MSDQDPSIQDALDALPDLAIPNTAGLERPAPGWTSADLERQLEYANQEGWLQYFEDSAVAHTFKTADILAIASRESNIKQILGDSGHGHGIMQIDDRFFGDFDRSGEWRNAELNIRKGCDILQNAYSAIKNGQGKSLLATIGGMRRQYTGKILSDAELMQTAIAAYNSGGTAYYWISTRGDPDFGTTGGNYSADTLRRSVVFQSLLANA